MDAEQDNPEKGEDLRPQIEGEDYVWENGYMVLTAKFLKKRGYCCESGCRECPYDYQKKVRGH
ncbi:MAG: DUF5522 domain-containing protein [Pseudomonadota bacterium]